MSPRPFSTLFLALLFSFFSFPPFSFFRSSLGRPPFIWPSWKAAPAGKATSFAVETESRPERELSSVSSSTETERQRKKSEDGKRREGGKKQTNKMRQLIKATLLAALFPQHWGIPVGTDSTTFLF